MGTRKKILMLAGVLSLTVIVSLAVAIRFDINSFKPRIETAASEATGLDVRIKGRMGIVFFPFGVSAHDIHVTGQGGEILSIKKLKLGGELIFFLKKQLKFTRCELVEPTMTVVKDDAGNYNFKNSGKKSMEKGPGAESGFFKELKLSRGELVYLDRKTGAKTEFKEINLELKDLSVGNAPGGMVRNASFVGTFHCKEVLQKHLRIENLNAPVVAVRGIYSFQPLVMGTLVSQNKKTGEKTEWKDISLSIRDCSVAGNSGAITKNISFTGNMECRSVRRKELRIDNVKGPLRVDRGDIFLKPFTVDIFDAKGEGDLAVDRSGVDAEYKLNLKVSKLDFAKIEETFGAKKVIGGKGDLYASLTLKGGRTLLGSLDGAFSLRGSNLVVYTMDLDKVLSLYEASQEFNLVDLGAFFIVGPLTNVVLTGDFSSQTRGGQGVITQFISHWKIKDGVAAATDCALATRHNRLALKGRLNLLSKRYDNMIVALLDDKGCVKFKQSVSGSFSKPQIGAVSGFETLGPIYTLYRKAERFVQGGRCEVFYNGSVRQP
jgi:AsmA protein